MTVKALGKFNSRAGVVYLDFEEKWERKSYVVTWEYLNEPQQFERFKELNQARTKFEDVCSVLMSRSEVM